ncbi:hypothetical protein [Actinoplanes sp. NPDC051494]|uniref:hypothetical protein n=1 Tax=Actinoplanes sp. NPDC051494 TaxID=3363907 RepID=UPI00378A9117
MVSRGVVAVLAAGLLSASAACGSADGAGTTADTGGSGQVHTVVNVDITGDVTVKGSATAPMPTNNGVDYRSCDQYGGGEADKEGRKYFLVPQMPSGTIGGKTVYIGAMIEDYQGAGTYDRKTLTDIGSPPGVSFGGDLYYTQSGTTSTVTTDGKGGGSWVFTGLSTKNPDGTEGGGPEVSGSVSWTCED